MTEKLVYLVEDAQGDKQSNYSTGTRVYTRKSNACSLSKRMRETSVVEYQLVPTGNVYDGNGELISLEDLDID